MSIHVYETLISRGGQVVGALAYSSYKKHKVEWYIQYVQDHQAEPDDAAIAAFMSSATLPGRIDAYLESGKSLAQQFLTTGLQQKLKDIDIEVRQSALAISFKDEIAARFAERKTVRAYLRDAGTSIITNVIALILAGALILGWRSLDDLSAAISNWTQAQSSVQSASATQPRE